MFQELCFLLAETWIVNVELFGIKITFCRTSTFLSAVISVLAPKEAFQKCDGMSELSSPQIPKLLSFIWKAF